MLQIAGFLRRRVAGMHSWNWDDLRFVAVLAETGTVAEAARRLNVNRTTVQRRISAFETQLSYPLFSRDGWGLKPLPEANPILEAARQIGDALVRIERKTTDVSRDIGGVLCLTTPDDIFLSGISEIIAEFQQHYPSLQVQLSVTTQLLDLDRRESEVAIRPSDAPPEHLVGRRICDLTLAPYAADAYLLATRTRMPCEQAWLSLQSHHGQTPAEVWLASNVPAERICFRADSFVATAEAARRGQGVAILPCCYGDRIEGLERVEGLIEDRLATGLWVLTHPDFRQSPRVRAAMDFFSKTLPAYRERFEA